jgi:hypothetical protein
MPSIVRASAPFVATSALCPSRSSASAMTAAISGSS